VWWSVTTGTQPTGSQPPMRGWAVGEWLADEASRRAAEQAWRHRSDGRPRLTDGCVAPEVEAEAVWIRVQLTEMLNQRARRIRITARSKRWWGPEIKAARQAYGQIRRSRKEGRALEDQERAARNAYLRIQRHKKRRCWTNFLETANSDVVWSVLRCTKIRASTVMGAITNEHGDRAEEDQDKRQMMAEVSFPAPNPYDGIEYSPGRPGVAHTLVTPDLVRGALFRQSNQKAPG
jgi:hypothetical protein